MNEKKKKKSSAPPRSALVAWGAVGVSAAFAALIFAMGKTLALHPLLVLACIWFLPALCNAAVMALRRLAGLCAKKLAPSDPSGTAALAEERDAAAEKTGEAAACEKGKRSGLAALCRRAAGKAGAFFVKRSTGITVLVVLAACILFAYPCVAAAKYPLSLSRAGYSVPIVLGVGFILCVILDKCCAAVLEDGATPPEDAAVLRGMRGAFTIYEIASIASIAAFCVYLLAAYSLFNVLHIVFAFLFVYEEVFIIVSLTVRVIRREFAESPELSIPRVFARKDLGIVGYLEKNTGMTVRSLWSIKLIRTVVPYAVIAVALVLWGATGIVRIEAHQSGALYRMGVLSEEVLTPGLHLTLPWPFDAVEVYDTEPIEKLTIGYVSEETGDNIWTDGHGTEEYKLLLGGGNELVSINLRLEYKISDLYSYLTGSSSPEKMLEAAAYETVTSKTIGTDLATLMAADRTAFAESFKSELAERTAGYNTGLEVVNVVLESIHPPVDVADIYQELISAEIDAEKLLIEAQRVANVTLATAESTYDTLYSSAISDKYLSVAAAKSAVSEFMAGVAADEAYGESYRYYKYMQAVCKAYSNSNLVIVGSGIDEKNIYITNYEDVFNGGIGEYD